MKNIKECRMRMDQHAWSVWSPHVSTCGDVTLSREAWNHNDVRSRDLLEPSRFLGITCLMICHSGAYLILSGMLLDKDKENRSWHHPPSRTHRPRWDLNAKQFNWSSVGKASSTGSVRGGGKGRNNERKSSVSGISRRRSVVGRGLCGKRL